MRSAEQASARSWVAVSRFTALPPTAILTWSRRPHSAIRAMVRRMDSEAKVMVPLSTTMGGRKRSISSTNRSGGTSTPRSIVRMSLDSSILIKISFPMSWTSPSTVPMMASGLPPSPPSGEKRARPLRSRISRKMMPDMMRSAMKYSPPSQRRPTSFIPSWSRSTMSSWLHPICLSCSASSRACCSSSSSMAFTNSSFTDNFRSPAFRPNDRRNFARKQGPVNSSLPRVPSRVMIIAEKNPDVN